MMPVLDTRDRVSLYACGAEPSANSFLPPPSTTGTVKMVIASTRSLARSAWTSSALPWVTRLGPSSPCRRLTSAMSRSSTEPCQLVSTPPERETAYFLISLKSDAAMGSVFVVVRPIRRENLVGLAAEQKIEFLTEEAVKFLAELLIEIGHHPAAELEPLGRILGRSAGRLHDAIHGNLGADDDFPHGSSSHRHDASSAFAGGSLERSLAGGRTARRRRLCPRLRPMPMLPRRWSAGSRSDR